MQTVTKQRIATNGIRPKMIFVPIKTPHCNPSAPSLNVIEQLYAKPQNVNNSNTNFTTQQKKTHHYNAIKPAHNAR